MFSGKIKGTALKALQRRVSKWSGVKNVAAKLVVPDELKWWHYQEFGTVEPYAIEPVEADRLAYPGAGGTVIRDKVVHPPLKPQNFVRTVLPDIVEGAELLVKEAFIDGAADNPTLLNQAVVQSVQQAKELIVDSISRTLTGHRGVNAQFPRQSGKLGDQTAAEVFEEKATVVEKTE